MRTPKSASQQNSLSRERIPSPHDVPQTVLGTVAVEVNQPRKGLIVPEATFAANRWPLLLEKKTKRSHATCSESRSARASVAIPDACFYHNMGRAVLRYSICFSLWLKVSFKQ